MASGRLIDYLGSGVVADRPATPDLLTDSLGLWYSTDTSTLSAWDGSTWEDVGGGSATDFTDLGDVPASYAGASLKVVRVNVGETALEFATAGAATLADGDYGDVTVSSSGTVITIDAGVVSLAKMADMATDSFLGRDTAGTGAPEVLSVATVKTLLGLTGTNSGDQTSIVGISGTKAQFDTACSDGDFAYQTDLTALDTRGKQAIYIGASAMSPELASPCSTLQQVATTSGRPDVFSLNFDATTIERAMFNFVVPEKWNGGTITYRVHWRHAATVTNFGTVWGVDAVSVANDETIDVAYGTRVDVTDTGGTTNDLYISDESSALTLAGTPAGGEMAFGRISRRAADGGDSLTIDAGLMGLTLYFTTDASTDA